MFKHLHRPRMSGHVVSWIVGSLSIDDKKVIRLKPESPSLYSGRWLGSWVIPYQL